MRARPFITCMLLLMVLTGVLLAFTSRTETDACGNPLPAETSKDDDSRLQASDGGIMWESVSRHLLSAVQ